MTTVRPSPSERFAALEIIEEAPAQRGRVTELRALRVRNHYTDGGVSRAYHLDVAGHVGVDAVAALPYWREGNAVKVLLLKSFRPALTQRPIAPERSPFLYECIAGVIEDGEEDDAGLTRRAAAELREEAGVVVAPERVEMLGPAVYVSPGIFTERVHLACVELADGTRVEPARDGSVMEELLEVVEMTLHEALAMCRRGEIREAKTELILRRLAERLAEECR